MHDLSVAYYGYPFDASGYGEACRATIHALHHAGIDLSITDLTGRSPQVSDALVEGLLNRPASPDFHLFHGIPPEWAARAFPMRNVIGMTVWETDTMPSQWRNILNHSVDVWLPCHFNEQVFNRALEKPTFILPHPLSESSLPPVNGHSCPLNGAAEGRFIFYSLFEWQDRKNPKGILEAYLRAFSETDPTLLVLKTNPSAAQVAQAALSEARKRLKSAARVELRAEAWSDAQICGLHERGDCYISLHRGEGWNYPLFKAAARGTPVVATAYSGPLDYLDPAAHRLVRCGLAPVLQPYRYYHCSMQWAEPDLLHAAEQLRWVFDNREAARSAAANAAASLRERYSPGAVGRTAVDRLLALLQRTQPQKWQRLVRSRQSVALKPAVPIPSDWYDHDYFETGRKSNWEQGYNWTLFGPLFQETARFLCEMFPEAETFLDAGCAMGYLVRALREKGKTAWGVDASPYALAHADQDVRSFLEQTSVDEYRAARSFDMLLAFSILESLTETQIQQFLARVRGVTGQAFLAVINSHKKPGQPDQRFSDDRDLSHITIRDRAWWHEQFLGAGWRQDAMCRLVQKSCQAHPLVGRMGWEVYLYAP